MTSKNDITGDSIQSKISGKNFDAGWDRIWGNKKVTTRKDVIREDGLTLYAAITNAGLMGTDAIAAVWAVDINSAYQLMEDWAENHFWDYNDESDFEDIEPEYDLYIEEWDDTVHPDRWPGGARYSHEFLEEDIVEG